MTPLYAIADPDCQGVVAELDITATKYHLCIDNTWCLPWEGKLEPINMEAALALNRVKPADYELYQELRGEEEACNTVLEFALEAGKPFEWSKVKEELQEDMNAEELSALADLLGSIFSS